MAHPVEGTPFMLAAARASVPPQRLSELLAAAASVLDHEWYDRRYERALAADGYDAYFVEAGHWAEVGDDQGWNRREHEAVARAHREQLLHAGKSEGRPEEFETALELREVVVISR